VEQVRPRERQPLTGSPIPGHFEDPKKPVSIRSSVSAPLHLQAEEGIMPLFRLSPINPSDALWGLSSACGVFVVRACDEAQARRIVAEHCAFGPSFDHTSPPPVAPWRDPECVSAALVDAPPDIADGEPGVVSFAESPPRTRGMA
jgi:hypothetical protein